MVSMQHAEKVRDRGERNQNKQGNPYPEPFCRTQEQEEYSNARSSQLRDCTARPIVPDAIPAAQPETR